MPVTRAQILYRLHELCLIVRRAFGEPAAILGDRIRTLPGRSTGLKHCSG